MPKDIMSAGPRHWMVFGQLVMPVQCCAEALDMSSTSGYIGENLFQESGPRIFDMSSASGYMGAKYFQEFGPRFFDMSSASGYMGAKYFQKIGPRFLA